jgi:nitrogenase molybdenum-iron protein alpha/beta subunit
VTQKAEVSHGHNLASDLFSPVHEPRIVPTAQDRRIEEVTSLLTERVPAVAAVLERAARAPGIHAVLALEFDYVHLTGFPLERVAAEVAARVDVPVLTLPCLSFDGDWLDGYARVLECLAEAVPLAPGRARPGHVAVVGYLYDRAEGDHRGNQAEIQRLLAPLGVTIASWWLGGQGYAELGAAAEASLVVSFPYARRAAARVAERLGVPLVEVDLPLGLAGTERFLRRVAEATGAADRVEGLIEREAADTVRDTERAVLRWLAGNRVSVTQDVHLAEALRGFADEVGLEVVDVCVVGRQSRERVTPGESRHVMVLPLAKPREPSPDVHFEVASPAFQRVSGGRVRVLFGYPNYVEHALLERPFLGYRGFRWLVEALVGARLRDEYGTALAKEER